MLSAVAYLFIHSATAASLPLRQDHRRCCRKVGLYPRDEGRPDDEEAPLRLSGIVTPAGRPEAPVSLQFVRRVLVVLDGLGVGS